MPISPALRDRLIGCIPITPPFPPDQQPGEEQHLNGDLRQPCNEPGNRRLRYDISDEIGNEAR